MSTTGRIEELKDKIESLEPSLDRAIEIAYLRGATEWVRLRVGKRPVLLIWNLN